MPTTACTTAATAMTQAPAERVRFLRVLRDCPVELYHLLAQLTHRAERACGQPCFEHAAADIPQVAEVRARAQPDGVQQVLVGQG